MPRAPRTARAASPRGESASRASAREEGGEGIEEEGCQEKNLEEKNKLVDIYEVLLMKKVVFQLIYKMVDKLNLKVVNIS